LETAKDGPLRHEEVPGKRVSQHFIVRIDLHFADLAVNPCTVAKFEMAKFVGGGEMLVP
jgi:hypothetical protein